MNKTHNYILLLLVLTACIDPIDLEVKEGEKRLVVLGEISNENRPYIVQLGETAQYSDDFRVGNPQPVSGAMVVLKSEDGEAEEMVETDMGVYESSTNGIKGEVGKKYFVEIETPDGKCYQSVPEVVQSPLPVDQVRQEFREATAVAKEGFYIFTDTQDPAETRNFYKWESTGAERWAECFKTYTHFSDGIIIDSDEFINGQNLSKLITVVPYTRRQPYLVTIEQKMMSEGGYRFWEGIQNQVENTGSIFDAPPTLIRGNIVNVDDPNDIVLGYFGAYGVHIEYFLVDRTQAERHPTPGLTIPPPPKYCGDPCNFLCVAFSGGKCGLPPCPPECDSIPDQIGLTPEDWPNVFDPLRCDP